MDNKSRAIVDLVLGLILSLLVSAPLLAQARLEKYSRNSSAVRRAFTSVVSKAQQSTVEVWADKNLVVLGTIISEDGYVLTKASELRGILTCKLANGLSITAELTGYDEINDLALLKLPVTGLQPIEWAKTAPKVGQWLATVGLSVEPEAVGVVSVASRDIKTSRYSQRGFLGINLADEAGKVQIQGVAPQSAADRAGLKVQDIVTELDGQKVESAAKLIELLRPRKPGEKVALTVQRDDRQMSFEVVLGRFDSLSDPDAVKNQMGGQLSERRYGFPKILQHDTALNPQQCGGPVVNTDGQAVGINIARAGRVESYTLPYEVIEPLFVQLKEQYLAKCEQDSEQLQLQAKRILELEAKLLNLQQQLVHQTKSANPKGAEGEEAPVSETDSKPAPTTKSSETTRETSSNLPSEAADAP